jgi:hypothetical protein
VIAQSTGKFCAILQNRGNNGCDGIVQNLSRDVIGNLFFIFGVILHSPLVFDKHSKPAWLVKPGQASQRYDVRPLKLVSVMINCEHSCFAVPPSPFEPSKSITFSRVLRSVSLTASIGRDFTTAGNRSLQWPLPEACGYADV